jgi:putative hydrolase of the HAD superfamily
MTLRIGVRARNPYLWQSVQLPSIFKWGFSLSLISTVFSRNSPNAGRGCRSVLFDLDDTLVAFETVRHSSWLQVCEEYHRAGARIPALNIFETIRKHNDMFWDDEKNRREGRLALEAARILVVSAAFSELGLPSQDAKTLAERYSIVRIENMYVLPGVTNTLQSLLDRHYEMALVTNGESATQRKKLERFALARYFKHVLIEEEMGYGKPDQRIYLEALSRLHGSPGESWMVGDNVSLDIAAPQSLGIRGIWYCPGRIGLPLTAPAIPFKIVHGTEEILEILK